MTLQNMQTGRIITAVIVIFVIGIVLSFVIQFGFVMVRFWDVLASMDSNATQAEQEQVIQDEIDKLLAETRDGSSTVNTLSMIQWGLTAVATFFVARRTARHNATSPEQAAGYGVAIGFGVMLLYGLCICSSATDILVKVAFFVLIVAAAAVGGQLGGQNLGARQPAPEGPGFDGPGVGTSPQGAPRPGAASGGSPETYYNMGVSAVLGGRREEARQHFTHVLQSQPRHVPAWLQLANLADTPEQAWNYVQQARSINPTDPAVIQAVSVIWPQVAAKASQPPHGQPPYPGGQQDDVAIPRGTLPGATPPGGVSSEAPTLLDIDTGDVRAAAQSPDADETDASGPDASRPDDEPPPPPPPPAQA